MLKTGQSLGQVDAPAPAGIGPAMAKFIGLVSYQGPLPCAL